MLAKFYIFMLYKNQCAHLVLFIIEGVTQILIFRKILGVCMFKKLVCVLSVVISSSAIAQESTVPLEQLINGNENTEAVCAWQTRCGFQTVCEWACLATSMAPWGSWWKTTASSIAGGKWCGDLCKKVEECKYGYYCDPY